MFVSVRLQDAAKLFAVPDSTLDEWIRQELVTTHVPPRGRSRGKDRVFDFVGLLAIGTIQTLRKKGASIESLRPIGRFFAETDFNRLGSEIAVGRSMLVSLADQTRLVSPAATIKHNDPEGELLIVVDLDVASQRLASALLSRGLLKISPREPVVAPEPAAN